MDKLLTEEEAAERLAVPPRFVRRLRSERRITFVSVGRRPRFRESDLEAFIARQLVEARR